MAIENSNQVPSADRRRPPAAGKGRVKGTPNKITANLKEAILMAAEQHGRDGEGLDGLTGYLRNLAAREPASFASLMGKLIPREVSVDSGPNMREAATQAVSTMMAALFSPPGGVK